MSKWAFKSNGRFIESFIDIGDDEEWRWTISNHMEVEGDHISPGFISGHSANKYLTIYIYIYISAHYTDTTASTLTRLFAKNCKRYNTETFLTESNALMDFKST